MVSGGAMKCSKYLLFTFNVIFWLGGCAILALGIYLIVDPTIVRYVHIIHISSDDPHLDMAAWIMIGLGSVVLLIGFLGCCGAIRESKCMLCLYILFLVIIILGEITPGILVFIYKTYVVYDVLLEGMQAKMRSTYGNGTVFDALWDFTQYEMKCCGVLTSKDYVKSVYFLNGGKVVPPSCCVLKPEIVRSDAFNITVNDAKNYTRCLQSAQGYIDGKTKGVDPEYIYKYGCRKTIGDWFDKYTIILLCVGAGIAGFEIMSIVLACCLCRKIKHEEYGEDYYED